ncbi:hypothetical protein AGR4C_Lc40335 [Agrobacterium tumefaciens str. Kerr 14]|uniref:Uncharacterized protein n=1 Tax=Agrobacterium tumefaciens str. Kerr 14 TaxID=1183424 RepID=A0A1S7RS71_AGRTU|nr:hypothetical protein AGR4C_Lc40335 [Agrobacterium tumefaciens str. Kerr 14]
MKAWQYSGGAQAKFRELAGRHGAVEELTGGCWTKPREINALLEMVPQAGIEPALLSEPHFECGASTNSAIGATVVMPRRLSW